MLQGVFIQLKVKLAEHEFQSPHHLIKTIWGIPHKSKTSLVSFFTEAYGWPHFAACLTLKPTC